MAVPKVGLQAEFILREFLKNQKKYEKALKDIDSQTKKTADRVTRSMGRTTKVFSEFADQSKVLQDLGRQLSAQDYIDQVSQLNKAFRDLGDGAKISAARFDELVGQGLRLDDALRIAATGAQFNKEKFDEALAATKSYSIALQNATGAIKKMSVINSLSAAVGVFNLAVGTSIKVIKDAIQQYNTLAKEVELIRLEMGITNTEASAWVGRMRLADASTASFTTALTQLNRNIVDTQLRLIEGKEASTQFTRAMKLLRVDAVDPLTGALRPTTDVMDELFEKIRELGPGMGSSAAATALFGKGAKNLLPVIFETNMTMEDITQTMSKYGAAIGDNEQLYREWREATFELWAAKQGAANFLARTWIPVIVKATEALAGLINGLRATSILAQGVFAGIGAGNPLAAFAAMVLKVKELTGATDESAQSELELAMARQQAIFDALAAADAEERLKEQREEALQDLEDLQQNYNEKLADIEVDFSDRWQDILIDRARDAEDRTIEMFQKLEDIWLKNQRKLEDITIRGTNRLQDVERDQARKVEDFQEQTNKKREDLELKHQDRLRKIQNRYLDTVEEAARRNDAVAVVAAIRRRNREIRDAEHQREIERRDLGRDLDTRRKEINKDFQRRRDDALRQQAEEEARAELAYQRAFEDLAIANERERLETLRKHRQQQQDFERAKRRAFRDAAIWYRRELQALRVHMQELGLVAEQGIIDVSIATANAVARGARMIADAGVVAIQSIGINTITNLGAATLRQLIEEIKRRRDKPPKIPGMAEGGVVVANRPTTVTMGEAGSEMHAFIPLRGAMNISHQFSRLPIDINGARGLDRNQVQSIVYDAMTDLARQLSPRWTRRR